MCLSCSAVERVDEVKEDDQRNVGRGGVDDGDGDGEDDTVEVLMLMLMLLLLLSIGRW
jgi:hypothetical protein